MRIGHGYDVHRLAAGRKLIIGGADIPHETGLLGHSDADVLLHAVMDAILGALGKGDIGVLFPDSDGRFEGADSMKLAAQVADIMKSEGYSVGNIDSTVIAQRPKLRPYADMMRGNIASVFGCGTDRVSVKATTEERLGFTGAEEGIAAHAVCILVKTSEEKDD